MRPALWGNPAAVRYGILPAIALAGLLAGCSTPPLTTARANFYTGRFEQANTNLAAIPKDDKDEVLYLMERGMIRQNIGQFEASSLDWRRAADLNAKLETYSISKGASSLVVNDRMLSFRGMPFERTLLYAFMANNYMAMFNWDFAAICARNIIKHLDKLDGFPDIAYGRYVAGFCFELINDEGNAAIQYKAAARLLASNLVIDALSGDIGPRTNVVRASKPNVKAALKGEPAELVCFISMGRMPAGETYGSTYAPTPYAELYCGNDLLGRSYPLANTADLMSASKRRLAAIQMAKDATRIATKVAISEVAKQQNDALGALMWLALFAMEMPDTRCWETLPLWLHVARVPCPANLTSYTVVFKSAAGHTLGTKVVSMPLSRRGNIIISFCRDVGR